MAEYIDRNKIPWAKTDNPKGKYWDRLICESTIESMEPADVVERSEYEYLKKENRELAIKYDNAMNMVINEQENVTRLRSKVKQAREKIDDLYRYYDTGYYSGNRNSMFKCSEVFKILDNLIAESET